MEKLGSNAVLLARGMLPTEQSWEGWLELATGQFPRCKPANVIMTSQNYVVWKDAFSVGSEEIDSQHKGMFGLLNDLYNALQEGRSQRDISEIVGKARQYAKQHFASEEAFWAKSDCPGLEEHKAAHQAYTRQVEQIWQRSGQPLADTAYELFFFLKEWWLSHITGMDAQYASSVRTVPSH